MHEVKVLVYKYVNTTLGNLIGTLCQPVPEYSLISGIKIYKFGEYPSIVLKKYLYFEGNCDTEKHSIAEICKSIRLERNDNMHIQTPYWCFLTSFVEILQGVLEIKHGQAKGP